MITGKVERGLEPTIDLRVIGPSGNQVEIHALIDTGFSGELTLPSNAIRSLGLARFGFRTTLLANGSTAVLAMFEASAVRDIREAPVQVLEAEGVPLVGMRLLRGFTLTIDVLDDGGVKLENLKKTL